MAKPQKRAFRVAISIAVLLCVAVFVWQKREDFAQSLDTIALLPASTYFVPLALLAVTFVLAAMAYKLLAFKPLRLRELVVVELAAAFATRVIPSGLGGVGVHGLYLYRRKHSVSQSTVIVSVNNLLGMSAHMLMLLVFLTLGAGRQVQFASPFFVMLPGLVGLILLLLLVALPPTRTRLFRALRQLYADLKRYARKTSLLFGAASSLVLLTLCNVSILYVLAQALGVELNYIQLFIVYSAGVLVGTATPTPGGLAGVEAGLTGGMVAYGVDTQVALSAALAFRFVTFWLPLLPGAIALFYVRQKKLL